MTAERDSPLLATTRHNHADVALALIQAGARLNSVDHSGDTPLLNAIDRGSRAAAPNTPDRFWRTQDHERSARVDYLRC